VQYYHPLRRPAKTPGIRLQFCDTICILRYNADMADKHKLSTDPYKGVRDFYPEDERVQEYIFSTMRRVAESFGYSAYSASVLEPAELYRAKSGEELVGEQMYVFTDRGGREVALRPEMTPSLARMVAGRRRELALPLRWYTIANMFRYERPQRGREREHWQLNVDYIGEGGVAAEAEVIEIAYRILTAFGLSENQFVIKLNNRRVVPEMIMKLGEAAGKMFSTEDITAVIRLFDKKNKMPPQEYHQQMEAIIGAEKTKIIFEHYTSENAKKILQETQSGKDFFTLIQLLGSHGIKNIDHDGQLVRGFDYYTGMIFEVFDAGGENRRSLFGGGRYDDLTALFGVDDVPAVGFGMGDVTIRDVLETYKLLPHDLGSRSAPQLYIATLGEQYFGDAAALALRLRAEGVHVAVDYTGRKIGDQIKKAVKDGVPYILCFGEEEVKMKQYRLKELSSGKETFVQEASLVPILLHA